MPEGGAGHGAPSVALGGQERGIEDVDQFRPELKVPGACARRTGLGEPEALGERPVRVRRERETTEEK